MRIENRPLLSGVAGTDQTIGVMQDFLDRSLREGEIRLLAINVLRYAGFPEDTFSKAQVIRDWVQSQIAYIADPRNVETVQAPSVTLQVNAGDCDDQALLVASMLESVGVPTRFKVIGVLPDRFEHVYTEALVDNDWVAVDTVEPPVGVDLNAYKFDKVYPIHKGGNMNAMNGYFDVAQSSAPKAAATYQTTLKALELGRELGEVDQERLRLAVQFVKGGDAPFSRQPAIVEPVLQAMNDYLAYMQSNQLGVASLGGAGLGSVWSVIWSGAKWIGTDLIWNNVKKIWEKTEVSIPDVSVTAPGVQVTPKVTSGDIGAGLSNLLSNPIVTAALAFGVAYLVARK